MTLCRPSQGRLPFSTRVVCCEAGPPTNSVLTEGSKVKSSCTTCIWIFWTSLRLNWSHSGKRWLKPQILQLCLPRVLPSISLSTARLEICQREMHWLLRCGISCSHSRYITTGATGLLAYWSSGYQTTTSKTPSFATSRSISLSKKKHHISYTKWLEIHGNQLGPQRWCRHMEDTYAFQPANPVNVRESRSVSDKVLLVLPVS